MASIHNEIRNRTDVLKAFERFFRLEHGAGIERIGETLTPIMDMWSRPELGAILGEKLWWGRQVSAAVAAQDSWCAVFNPAGSPRLVTVLGWRAVYAGASGFLVGSLGQATVVGGTVIAADARDRRFGSSSSIPEVKLSKGTEVPTTLTGSWAGSAGVIEPIPVVLSPGNNVAIEGGDVNTALAVNWFGLVRQATDDELKLTATA